MSDSENPFAALGGLTNLPKGPENVPDEGNNSGASAGAGVPANVKVRVLLDRKHRRGKVATLVTGLGTADPDYLDELTKKLKTSCGVGGAVKEGEIIIQGDKRDRVIEILRKEGFTDVKKSGG